MFQLVTTFPRKLWPGQLLNGLTDAAADLNQHLWAGAGEF